MYSWLQEAVAEQGEVVTASRRLARELRDAYNRQQVTAGRRSWLTPTILSWHDWLSCQLERVRQPAELPRIIDPASSALVWERCLREHCPDGLPGFGSLVRQAIQSWVRSEEWRIPVTELRVSARSQDERVFAEAAQDYRRCLADNNWIDAGGKSDLVGQLLVSGSIVPSPHITFAGFDRVSPAVRQMMTVLKQSGAIVVTAPDPSNAGTSTLASFEHAEAELRAAGAWARVRLDEDSVAKIAIVVPGLESGSAGITRLVREGLVPGWQYGAPEFSSAANVSYGRRLAEYPAVSIALLVLRWAYEPLSSREISPLLRSRCLVSDAVAGRSRLEIELRDHPDRYWLPEDFLRVFGSDDAADDAKRFLQCVSTLADLRSSHGERLQPGEWVRRIDTLLTSLQWPGPASLESDEFQLVNRWRELLNEFARIEIVAPLVDLGEVVRRLGSMAADILYQPESGPGIVQVLGVLEATGMEFDHVWVCGMDSSQWPPASTPTRFISLSLQREYRMPDATPTDTLEFARQVLRGFAASARHCVFSSVTSSNELELTPTSLLDELDCVEIDQIEDPGWYARNLAAADALPVELDDPAPPIGAHERIRGGAYTVQRQFTEPFSAFVHGRLGVRLLEKFAPGLSTGLRGNIVHDALHNLLASRPSQDEIVDWTEKERLQRIGSAVDASLAAHVRYADSALRRIIRLERGRLLQLLENFLSAETKRTPFAVAEVERRVAYKKFGIELGLRIDRVDRLADGSLLVIDYKTGIPKHFLDRNGNLTDLQLVVYADALADHVGGLALMNIDSRTIESKGAGAGGAWSPKNADEWDQTLHSWRTVVHRVIEEIAAGDVRVNRSFSANDNRPLAILSRKGAQPLE
ncbi:MAG: PD-(D/E)XK nuclease family protein [Woeseiaceae bacterium]